MQMDTTMELDELKQAWQTLDRRLARQHDIQWQLLRDRKLDKVRGHLRPLIWGQVMQVLLGIGLILLGVGCWSRNPDAPVLFATGIAVHVFGVVNIILAGMTMGRIAGIDYSAPVLTIQKQSARLLQVYLINGNVCGMSWWVAWLPVTMAFAGLAGIDLARQAPGFISIGIAVGAAGLVATWYYLRWSQRRAADGDVGDGGDGIRRSRRLLDEIARFESE